MKNALILLAGGTGKRFNISKKNQPKQFYRFGNSNFIEYFLTNLDENIFDIIKIVTKKYHQKKYLNNLKKNFPKHKIEFVASGKTRQESSKKGVYALKKYNPQNVLIHDSARPLTSNKLIKKLIKQLDKYKASAPYITNNDYLINRYKNDKIKNEFLIFIQTPQAFKFNLILKAHQISNKINYNDDTSIVKNIGIKTKFIKGEKRNLKITYKEDLDLFLNFKKNEYRHGIGYDIHKINYKSKKFLILCGVKIPHPPLEAHSDGDVGYHAICDSILGALSMKDIGFYFNNKNLKWKNANSKIFMLFCYSQLKKKKYNIVNLDINFICENPNISKYSKLMKKNISKIFKIAEKIISIKATTNEKIGFIGNGEGIAAEAIVQIKNE